MTEGYFKPVFFEREKVISVYEHMDGQYDYNDSSEISEPDLSLWHKEIELENRYNRLIVYNGDDLLCIETNAGCHPENQHDGRLFQTFFFDTE